MSTTSTQTSAAPSEAIGDDAVSCTACGGANAADSRFCRLCGAGLHAESPAADASGTEATVFDRSVAPAAEVATAETASHSAPSPALEVASEADTRQARQLLDRAFTLVERGDMANALLSCRQSVALAPNAPQGFSMLGQLLERSGDLEQAAAAYARVLKLAPQSRLETESLSRVRAALDGRRGEIPVFRFDERELDEARASAPPVVAAPAVPLLAPTAGISGAASTVSTSAIITPSGPATIVSPLALSGASSVANIAAPAPDSYPSSPLPTLIVAGATAAPGVATNISALHFDVPDVESEPRWKRVLAQPSAFSRGLPLAGVAGLSLLFLIWARGAALSRYPQDSALPSNIDSTPIVTSDVPPPGAGTSQPATTGTNTSGGVNAPASQAPAASYPVSNTNAAPPVAPPAPPASGTNGSGGAPIQPSQPSQPSQQNVPGVGRVAPRPQPVFPAAERVAPAIPNSLPPMRVPQNQAPPSVSVVPDQPQQQSSNSGGGLTSAGGGPLGPTTSSSNNSITLTRPRNPIAALPRISASRNQTDTAASRAMGSGRPDVAIANSNQTIRSGGETGWTYQQRALGFLNKGDYQRAADDFQTAISAYRDQKARGERATEAQAGIDSCQSGLKLALINLRR